MSIHVKMTATKSRVVALITNCFIQCCCSHIYVGHMGTLYVTFWYYQVKILKILKILEIDLQYFLTIEPKELKFELKYSAN